jgi:hypothetical protein
LSLLIPATGVPAQAALFAGRLNVAANGLGAGGGFGVFFLEQLINSKADITAMDIFFIS